MQKDLLKLDYLYSLDVLSINRSDYVRKHNMPPGNYIIDDGIYYVKVFFEGDYYHLNYVHSEELELYIEGFPNLFSDKIPSETFKYVIQYLKTFKLIKNIEGETLYLKNMYVNCRSNLKNIEDFNNVIGINKIRKLGIFVGKSNTEIDGTSFGESINNIKNNVREGRYNINKIVLHKNLPYEIYIEYNNIFKW